MLEEVIQGNIPSSVNLPLSDIEAGLKLEPGNFQKKFAFGKPRKDQRIIVYCKAGVRSSTASKHLVEKGYKRCVCMKVPKG